MVSTGKSDTSKGSVILSGSDSKKEKIYPVILSGGAGKRLWPLSTVDFPKQFHALYSDKPIIVETALRVQGDHFASPTVICNEAHRFHVASTFQDYNIGLDSIILEPCARNTTAAIATAVHHVAAKDPNAIVLILPSDHYIRDAGAFNQHICDVAMACDDARILTFGIEPTQPETGYGYIHKGHELGQEIYQINKFVEKPDVSTAKSYINEGNYYWNSGIFMASVKAFSESFLLTSPMTFVQTRAAYDESTKDLDFLRLDRDLFAQCDDVSFDYAVMEKLQDQAVVCPLSIEWNDLGSWSALWDVADKDEQGNAVIGNAVQENNNNCYIRNSNDRSLAVMGLQDIVVLSSQNAVTVAHKNDVQNIRKVYESMIEDECPSTRSAIKRSPWGYSKTIKSNDHFAAKEVVINPGQKTAIQVHNHRSEHWVVLEGEIMFTVDGKKRTLKEGESLSAMPGTQHAMENKGDKDAKIFEVQSGNVQENDILRVYEEDKISKTKPL